MAGKTASLFKSVLGALFGVQSDKQRQHDFSQGKAWKFIVLGIVMVIVFVLSIALLVKVIT
ncbi:MULTISPECIES: DUF2970 domain-containing protein [unclassified Agarivorans]|uniref:DUF2970 domain-containing protein n=1 Tax=unclassified Agarivorans TaxID=2636026 RepID=UPI0026E275AE|nr:MULTISPECIES: DUF2970 domain-containing protein [unclassified Agarivorans]MDO6686805.1 DUF2970 domain-containing protein [Agarivorans sp. 3_MG-2023]MDO6716465.1 DUF2970 domain-containing protein [Agarivorans sp. 2_MG-2023]